MRSAANPPNAGHRGFRSGDEHATAGSRSSPTASGTTVNRLAANAVPTSPRSSRIKKETLYQIGDIVYGRKADGGMWLAQLKSQVVRTTDLTKRQNKVTYNDERPKVRFFVPTGIASSGSSSAAYSYARDGAQRASTILGSLRVTVLNTDSTTSRNEVVSFAVTHGELTTARRHIIFGESNVVPPARPFVPAADTRGVATGQPHNYPGSLPAVVPGHVVADSSTVTADEASLQHLSEEEQIAMALQHVHSKNILRNRRAPWNPCSPLGSAPHGTFMELATQHEKAYFPSPSTAHHAENGAVSLRASTAATLGRHAQPANLTPPSRTERSERDLEQLTIACPLPGRYCAVT